MIQRFLELIYPKTCLNCEVRLYDNENFICLGCRLDIPIIPFMNGRNEIIERQLGGKVLLEYSFSYMYYSSDGVSGRILKEIKYHKNEQLGLDMGKEFGRQLARCDFFKAIDCIIPVPLHPDRYKQRGFNQCEVLARGVQMEVETPIVLNALKRTNNNATQTKKGRIQRLQDLEFLFELVNPSDLKGLHVLLLDDVITTGATLEAVFAAFKGQDDIIVSFATLCSPIE